MVFGSHEIRNAKPQQLKTKEIMSKTSNSLIAFLTGCVTGAALGILYAPDKGAVLRTQLTYRLSKYRERLEDVLEDLLDKKDLHDSSARTEGERVVNDAREKAEKLLEDVDRLMAQIKGQAS
jgi:gas vesicle protein